MALCTHEYVGPESYLCAACVHEQLDAERAARTKAERELQEIRRMSTPHLGESIRQQADGWSVVWTRLGEIFGDDLCGFAEKGADCAITAINALLAARELQSDTQRGHDEACADLVRAEEERDAERTARLATEVKLNRISGALVDAGSVKVDDPEAAVRELMQRTRLAERCGAALRWYLKQVISREHSLQWMIDEARRLDNLHLDVGAALLAAHAAELAKLTTERDAERIRREDYQRNYDRQRDAHAAELAKRDADLAMARDEIELLRAEASTVSAMVIDHHVDMRAGERCGVCGWLAPPSANPANEEPK